MFSSIVLATDGSDHASRALDVAIDLAIKYASRLTIVHVLTKDHPSEDMQRMIEVEHLDKQPLSNLKNPDVSQTPSTFANQGMLRSGDRESRVINVIGEQILKAASHQAQVAGVKEIDTEICDGDYANDILEVAESNNADVIIMGRRGLSTLKGFITGSVSHKVSQRADCSVLTVK